MNGRDSILIVEDEKLIRMTLRERLLQERYHVAEAASGQEALEQLTRERFDLMLLDYRLPDMTGLDVLRSCREACPETLAIMITAYSSIDGAVEAIKQGAYHYLKKPVDHDDLLAVLAKALETLRLRREIDRLRDEQRRAAGIDALVGSSRAMQQVLAMIRKVAASDAARVLITGESGTGKGLAAKAVHYSSRRADKPFVEITCSALPETLLESELFGHERGAFTDAKQDKKGLLALGDGGTVMLDEIGDMSLPLQAKLLRFLEDKTFRPVGGTRDIRVDVRIIAATHRNLQQAARDGQFRDDLYYRLQVIPISLPPLRERKDDIPELVQHFLGSIGHDLKKEIHSVTPDAMAKLMQYDWPGNVRELRNVVEHAVILSSGHALGVAELPAEIARAHRPPVHSPEPPPAATFRLPPEGVCLRRVEQSLVKQALELTHGNQSRAARLLGIRRDALRYRLKKYGMLR